MLTPDEKKELEIFLKELQFDRDIIVTLNEIKHYICLLKQGEIIGLKNLILECCYLVYLCEQQKEINESKKEGGDK